METGIQDFFATNWWWYHAIDVKRIDQVVDQFTWAIEKMNEWHASSFDDNNSKPCPPTKPDP